jgi:hypothetical protein
MHMSTEQSAGGADDFATLRKPRAACAGPQKPTSVVQATSEIDSVATPQSSVGVMVVISSTGTTGARTCRHPTSG